MFLTGLDSAVMRRDSRASLLMGQNPISRAGEGNEAASVRQSTMQLPGSRAAVPRADISDVFSSADSLN